MRRALGILTLFAVMVMAAANIVLRSSGGFGNGQSTAALVRNAMGSVDYASLVFGLSAGMILMWVFFTPRVAVRGGGLVIGPRLWPRRLALIALLGAGAAALVYY